MQDNYDGSTSTWGIGDSLTDAVQVTDVFNSQTSALHHLRITVTCQLYALLPLGSIPDKTRNDSFNITQIWLALAKDYVALQNHPAGSLVVDNLRLYRRLPLQDRTSKGYSSRENGRIRGDQLCPHQRTLGRQATQQSSADQPEQTRHADRTTTT